VLLVLWQHLCAQQLHLAQLFEHTERIVLAIRIVDQHVAEINHGDINGFKEVLAFEKFLFVVEVVNEEGKNRFPAVFIVGKRVFENLAHKNELLDSCLLDNVHEFLCSMLLVS